MVSVASVASCDARAIGQYLTVWVLPGFFLRVFLPHLKLTSFFVFSPWGSWLVVIKFAVSQETTSNKFNESGLFLVLFSFWIDGPYTALIKFRNLSKL